jgi:hypothetical protein
LPASDRQDRTLSAHQRRANKKAGRHVARATRLISPPIFAAAVALDCAEHNRTHEQKRREDHDNVERSSKAHRLSPVNVDYTECYRDIAD